MKYTILKNIRFNLFDMLGFSISSLCSIYCIILPFILSSLPLLGLKFLGSPTLELTILLFSITLAFISFLIGYCKHHKDDEALSIMLIAFIFILISHTNIVQGNTSTLFEQICMPIGGMIMAYAHYRNWQLCKENNYKKCNS